MRSKYLRVLLALLIPLSSAVTAFPASAALPFPIYLCEAGNYGSLSKVLTKGDGAVIHYSPRSGGDTTFIGAESSVEADAFIAGSNMTSQKSSADYIAAQGRLRLAIDSAKTNLLPTAYALNAFSLHLESITGGSLGTFGPGVYKTIAAMNMAANETITLTGGPNDEFVFISGAALTLGANTIVQLQGGAQAKNVYWVIGTFVGDQTIGSSSTIVGNILVDGSATFGAGTHINGRVLAVNTVSYGAGSYLEVLPPNTLCGTASGVKSIPFTDSTLVDATIGTFYSDTVTAEARIDNVLNSDPITYSVDTLPSGLTLDTTTGVVSGIPTDGAAVGPSTSSFTAFSPSYPSPIVQIILKVKAKPVKSIVFTDTTLIDATIGTFYTDTVTAEARITNIPSRDAVTYALTGTPLPGGLTLNSSTGVVSGTLPDTTTVTSSWTVTIEASSAGYPSQSLSYTFAIKARPVKTILFTDKTLVSAVRNSLYSDLVNAVTQVDGINSGATITYSLSGMSLPTGLMLNALTGVISGTPTTLETQTVLITADSSGYPSQSETITIIVKTSVVKSIVFTDTTLVNATIGSVYSDTATAGARTDNVYNSDPITYAVDSLPSGLTLNPNTGVISGTVTDSTPSGSLTIRITASSAGYADQSLPYTLVINAKSSPPQIDTGGGVGGVGGGSSATPIAPLITSIVPIPPVVTPPVETSTVVTPQLTNSIAVEPLVSTESGVKPTDIKVEEEIPVSVKTVIKKPINTLMLSVLFGNNSAQLDLKTQSAIKAMAVKIKKLKIATLTVVGYSSSAGGVDNLKLSVARAKTVAAFLVSNGVKTKITIKGLGVIASSGTKSALALTRKAEIWILLKP